MIAVIDVGLGNIKSILKMYEYLGEKVFAINDIKKLDPNNKIILPGVGKFDEGVRVLKQSGFFSALNNDFKILGICLGMQLLCNESEEGSLAGLGLIPAKVKKFNKSTVNMRIPHMGWNNVILNNRNPLVHSAEKERFYFVHSYYCVCDYDENVFLKTDYFGVFASGIFKKNIFGVQFHPEKSHKFGMKLLKNFSEV